MTVRYKATFFLMICFALISLSAQQECQIDESSAAETGELLSSGRIPSMVEKLIVIPLQNFMDLAAIMQATFIIICSVLVSKAKHKLIIHLARFKDSDSSHLGRFGLFNNLVDFVIFAVTLVFLSDVFSLSMGPGMKSLFAAGGMGALIFGLASKGLAEQVVGGLVVCAWDVFEEGDEIVLTKTGISGTVKRIRLADTAIMQHDNILVKVPNSQIFIQPVSNLSRVKMSPVGQSLRFKYSDLKKLPKVVEDIKKEILIHCGEDLVVVDGSKPFRAHIYDYKEDHVEVMVKCHLRTKPASTAYLDGRQKVLAAIAAVVEKNGLNFAIPAV
eukprot:CAMPEP_0198143462 /NCGR_PEP_ID=MMETSP1443-20131203/7702_1 /TAXON_ID=186043 /ORGANISM="Entomoneis sp., Strain CCMP2396" /LENGTH=328 /DNA_ID=CAMNT_0043806701 /DNA_START=56 /DNA_END=1039 /DNA_ORIENTATION=+